MGTLDTCPDNSNDEELCTEGSSLLPLIDDPDSGDWKEAVFWQFPRGRRLTNSIKQCMGYSIRTKSHCYTEWVKISVDGDGISYEPEWDNLCDHAELYDLDNDAEENHNVYHDGQYADIVNDLRGRLKAGWRAEI